MASKVLSRSCKLCLHKPLRWRSMKLTTAVATSEIHTNSTGDIQTADIVISGGGMVGAAMASSLGQSDMLNDKKIVLLESAPKQELRLTERYNSRVCALSNQSVDFLSTGGNLTKQNPMKHLLCSPKSYEAPLSARVDIC
ncbi:hypothetical protein ScPMuIL_013798 [Solemya velum]